jgi:hypothetical protein
VLLLVPQENEHAVAVDHHRHRLHQPFRHLVPGAGARDGLGQAQERVRLFLTPPRVAERGGGVEHRSGVTRVHLEEVALRIQRLP